MRRLAVIATDPVDLYLSAGYGAEWLRAYFNPAGLFDEVYSLAPYERVDGALVGLVVRPTPLAQLHQRLRELKIDVVRAYGGSQACDIACRDKVSGVPVVVSVHDVCPALLYPSIAGADVVLCVSEAVRELVARRVPHDRVWVLPNRADFGVMRPYSFEETSDLEVQYPQRHRILHVGRKTRQKNLDNLIAAVGLLGPDYCLLAVGKGDADPYRALAAQAGAAERCHFIDAIANEELPRYFSWADCMCNPSRWEGMSIVLVEALAAGAILVASDIPEIRETVTHGHNGLLVEDFENPAAIAQAIHTACTDGGVRRHLRQNARPSVERFERRKVDALEAGFYETVLELRAQGMFTQPLSTRIGRSAVREARRVLPPSVKNLVRPLVSGRVEATR